MDDVGAFRRLAAWQKAYDLARSIYKAAETFPRAEQFGLTSQLQRAALSVPSNIAEGYGRGHQTKDFARFLLVARGSLYEVETCLLLARDLGFLTESSFEHLNAMRQESASTLGGLIKARSE